MNVLVSKKKPNGNVGLSVIKCSCGAKILLVPDVKLMSEAIEAHVEEHKQKINDPTEADVEAENIRTDLIIKVLNKANEA